MITGLIAALIVLRAFLISFFLALEKLSVAKSLESIRSSHVVVLLIDSRETMVDQDMHLLGLSLALGRPVIIGMNKVDLLKDRDHASYSCDDIARKIRFAKYIKIHQLSAKDGSGIDSLIRLAEKAYSISIKDLETPILNKILQQATKMQPPPYNKKFRPNY